MERKQIVIFGGCFNPPLNSHFSLAQQIINEYENIEQIIFVPVNSKYQKADLISNEHRYKMLKLACDKNEKFDVSRIELDSPRPLYTIETLRIFQETYSKYQIAFIIGSDNLKEINTWEKAEELTKDFKIYVLERDKDNIEEILKSNGFLNKNKQAFIKVKDNITSNLSSTFVRNKLKNGKSVRYLTTDEVVSYIEENKLYK